MAFARREEARIFQQGQHSLVPVLLRESVLDSVSFRAATKHFEDQVEAVDAWLNGLIKNVRDFTSQFCRLEEQATGAYNRVVPTFVESGILDTDYTVATMSRFSDANRAYWTSIFTHIKGMETTLTEPLLRLQHNELREIRHLKNEFGRAQKAYDEQFRSYYQQPKTKEASSLREDAFQLYEKRKAYIKASFDYSTKMSTFRNALDSALIAAFSQSFEAASHHTSALATDFASRPSMNRIIAWSDEMVKSSRSIEEHLYTVRFELEDELNRLVSPPRDLAEYSQQKKVVAKDITNFSATKPAKQGWLMMRAVTGKPARYVWHRRWFYIKDGIFGWLSNNAKNGAVEESDKIGVLLCNVKLPSLEDRRFCFEVLTKDSTILLQAESDLELANWLSVFEIAKKAILTSQQANGHAFAVNKPHAEFAAAFQALEGGHGETQTFDAITANKDLSKKGHSKNDSGGGHGIGALMSASAIATTLSTPRMNGIFGKMEERQCYNPFESSTDPRDLAPAAFAPSPINTHLTREAIMDETTSITHIPSGTQANFWGSLNYGMLNISNRDSLQGPGVAKLLAAPEIAVDKVYALRDKELSDRGILNTSKEFPPEYPTELQKQDAQFRALFPHARAEHVLMMVRGTRTLAGHKALFSGRFYATLRGLYFYSQSCGMVLLQTCLYSEILNVRVNRKVSHDELAFDIHDVGEATTLIYLDDANLVKKRIEILLANYIADEPRGVQQILSVLQSTLPDATTGMSRMQSASKVPDAGSGDEDYIQRTRKGARIEAVRLKLPSEPVLNEPDVQMLEKTYDCEFMISAKGLFHLFFGNRSPLWLQICQAFGYKEVEQGPWQEVEDGTLVRALKYIVYHVDHSGKTIALRQTDYQKIEKREEHLEYTVMLYRRPTEYPYSADCLLKHKFNVTFVSKARSRVRVWTEIDWQKRHIFSRGVITKAVLADLPTFVVAVAHFCERELLDRLGLQSKTSKAVRIYGRVGGHHEPIQLEVGPDSEIFRPPRKSSTVFDLIYRYPWIFLSSLLHEITNVARTTIDHLRNFISANGVLLVFLLLSVFLNTWQSSRSGIEYWRERTATGVLRNIQTSPIGLMSRGVTITDIESIAHNATSDVASGRCFQTFKAAQGKSEAGQAYYSAFHPSRLSLAQSRHDLLVAMKVLNGIEIELVEGQWLDYLGREKEKCRQLAGLGVDMSSEEIQLHCQDCLQYSDL